MKVTLKKLESNESEFWEYYLHLRNVNNNLLTKVELEFLTKILVGDPYKSMFSGEERKKLRGDKYSNAFISQVKKSLITKGYLTATGVVEKDVLVSQPLRNFQFKVKEKIARGESLSLNLEFTFEEV